MRAIILAAGMGRRLSAETGRLPKCLLRFAGSSLLERHIRLLQRLGVAQLDLVLGYESDRVLAHIAELAPGLPINVHFNRSYEQGSGLSLLTAGDALRAGEPVLVMDADVLYSPRILQRLVASPHANCLLIDRDFVAGEEPVKVCLRAGRVVEFRKRLSSLLAYELIGESVGFFRFDAEVAAALAIQLAHYTDAGMAVAPHEEAIRDLLLAAPERFACEDITGEPWIEIDFPQDLERAAREIQPAVDAIFI